MPFDFGKLEEDYRKPYEAYKLRPTPGTRGAMLAATKPIMDLGINTYIGSQPNPILRGRAKSIVLGSLDGYDPTRGTLKAHLMSSLQGLQRYNQQAAKLLSVPERVSQDNYHLSQAENELRDVLGRDPSTDELSDHMGLSPKRIEYVRNLKPAMASGQMESIDDGEGFSFDPGVIGPDRFLSRLQFLYDDLDPVDQVLAEYGGGMRGRRRLSGKQLARKVNLSPGAVSQRLARLQQKIDELDGTGLGF